jgi:hypothetical protein
MVRALDFDFVSGFERGDWASQEMQSCVPLGRQGSSRRMMPWRGARVCPLLFPQVSRNGIFQGIGRLDLY